MAAYLSVFRGVENGKVKLASLLPHPCIERALATCLAHFKAVRGLWQPYIASGWSPGLD